MWLRALQMLSVAVGRVIPHYFLILLSTIIVITPLDPAKAAQDFTVYRAQQYDFQGVHLGSRGSLMNCEAQALSSRLIAKKCLVLNLTEVTIDIIKSAVFHNIAGILIILPSQPWSDNLKEHFMHLERELLNEEISLPVYFVIENDVIGEVFKEVKHITATDIESTSAAAILNVISSTGYRMSVQTSVPKVAPGISITNIEGRLMGPKSPKVPVVVLCAYYDSMSAIPGLAYGSDANGSGVVALLELARVFSRIFANAATRPKYDLVFLLSGGGKFNFMGTKRWLDQKIEDTAGLAMLDAVTQVLCLEGLGTTQFGHGLHVHLSRLPKNGSFSQRFVDSLKVASQLHPFQNFSEDTSVQVVHKKINLNQELLGWEHERFSIHRLPGMTLSSWPSVQVATHWRQSSLDGGPLSRVSGPAVSKISGLYGAVNPSVIARNTRVVAEALARVLLELDSPESGLNSSALIAQEWISETTSRALLDLMVRQPRSTQMLHIKPKSPASGTWRTNPGGTRGSNRASATESKWPGLVGSLEHHLVSLLPQVQTFKYPLSRDSAKAGTTTTTTTSSSSGTVKESDGSAGSSSHRSPESAESSDSASDTQSVRTASILTSAAAAAEVDVVLYTEMAPTTLVVHKLKSSMFDLVVAFGVASYLGLIYLFLENFHQFQRGLYAVVRIPKTNVQ